jgi:hypothetical protein
MKSQAQENPLIGQLPYFSDCLKPDQEEESKGIEFKEGEEDLEELGVKLLESDVAG